MAKIHALAHAVTTEILARVDVLKMLWTTENVEMVELAACIEIEI